MKKVLISVVLSLVVLGICAIKFAGSIIFYLCQPAHDFSEVLVPAPPDYANPDHWLSVPERPAEVSFRPKNVLAKKDTLLQKVDVFFIPPTTYFMNHGWNAPLTTNTGTAKNARRVLANNASIFNDCKVYVPNYRQATMASFLAGNEANGKQAFDLAYEDVQTAFAYFLTHFNQGRPYILAGHSQGTLHGFRLIQEKIDGTPLAEKMIAAYLPGFPSVTDSAVAALQTITFCETPEQTNCLTSWSVYREGVRPNEVFTCKSCAVVNPISWIRNGGLVAKEKHLGYVPESGTLTFKMRGEDTPNEVPILPLAAAIPQHTYANCVDGIVWVAPQEGQPDFMNGNYHSLDFPLFYMDVKANVALRIKQYFTE